MISINEIRKAINETPSISFAYAQRLRSSIAEETLADRKANTQARASFLRAIREGAVRGKVCVRMSGRDCDGQWHVSRASVDANVAAVEEHIAHAQYWADGHCWFAVESEANAICERVAAATGAKLIVNSDLTSYVWKRGGDRFFFGIQSTTEAELLEDIRHNGSHA